MRRAADATIFATTLTDGGTNGGLDPVASDYVLAQLIRGVKLKLYPDAGHAFLFQDEKAFVPLSSRFSTDSEQHRNSPGHGDVRWCLPRQDRDRSGPHRRERATVRLAFEGASGSAGRTESTFTSKRQTWPH
ncbi:MAG: hypothetical protein ACM3ML_22935 [Micromonosporaceae bacterium]